MNSTVQEERLSRSILIATVVIDLLCVIFGIIGNIVVTVYNVFLNINRNPTSYFVLNLAVSDLLVCGIYFPTYITQCVRILLGNTEDTNLACQINLAITGASLSLSVVNIMVLTIDRYISITLPLKYPNIVTSRRACIALVGVWCAGLTNGVLIFANTKSTGVPLLCEVDMIVSLGVTVVCFYIPLTATVVFNIKILRIARAQRRKIAAQATPCETSASTAVSPRRHLARQFKLFKTFTVVFGCFIFCVTPLPVLGMTNLLVCGGECIPTEVIIIAGIMAGANSILNPFIYGVRHEEYRRAFKLLLYQPCNAF